MSGSQLITWPMPLMSYEISTFITPPPPPHTIQVIYNGENPLRRGVMSEYDPAYQTPCFLMHLQSISEAPLCTLMHCTLDSACYATLHHSLHPHLHMCCLCLFVCLFVSPSGLSLLIDGQWTSAKSNCTHSIRRGLSRRLRSSLLLNSSPRCNPPCRIVY